MLRFTTLALILAAASPARADDLTYKWARQFSDYKYTTREMTEHAPSYALEGHSDDDCANDIAKAKAEGLPADAMLWEDLKFADVGKALCEPYARAFRVSVVAHPIFGAWSTLRTLGAVDMEQANPEHQASLQAEAKACLDAVDLGEKQGLGDVVIFDKMTISAARAKTCEPYVEIAKSWAASATKAREAEYAELAGPYKKVGIKGDKLQFCVDNASHAVRGPRAASLTPAQMKNASVMFVLWEDSATGVFTLQRYTFKADKLVNRTEQQFVLRPGAGAYK